LVRILKKFGKVVTIPISGILHFQLRWEDVFWGTLEGERKKTANQKTTNAKRPLFQRRHYSGPDSLFGKDNGERTGSPNGATSTKRWRPAVLSPCPDDVESVDRFTRRDSVPEFPPRLPVPGFRAFEEQEVADSV